MATISTWQASNDGDFGRAFANRCLTPTEIRELQRPSPQSIPTSMSMLMSMDENNGKCKLSLEIRKVLVRVVLAWTDDYAGGVILKCKTNRSLFQVFEFISPHKRLSNTNYIDNTNIHDANPLVLVSYAVSSSMKKAKLLLRGEEVAVITGSDSVMLEMARLYNSSFAKSGLIDFVSGLIVREGYLEPICPSPPTLDGRLEMERDERQQSKEEEEEEDAVEEDVGVNNFSPFEDTDFSYPGFTEENETRGSKRSPDLKHCMLIMILFLVFAIISYLHSTAATSFANPFLSHKFSINYHQTIKTLLGYCKHSIQNAYLSESWKIGFPSKEKVQYTFSTAFMNELLDGLFQSYKHVCVYVTMGEVMSKYDPSA